MNYYSKYVKRYQQGGSVEPTDDEILDYFISNKDAIIAAVGADSDMGQQLSTIASQLEDPQMKAQILDPENSQLMDAIRNIVMQFSSNSAQSQETTPQAYKMGGKVAYLGCLKKGGSIDCGCKKSVVKAEGGTILNKLDAFLKKFTTKNPKENKSTLVYINENGIPYENQTSQPGELYTAPYGIVDGNTVKWYQNIKGVGPSEVSGGRPTTATLSEGRYILK